MSETHIFTERLPNGMSVVVKADTVVQAWGVLRDTYPDADFDYRGTVDENIPQEEGIYPL